MNILCILQGLGTIITAGRFFKEFIIMEKRGFQESKVDRGVADTR